MNKKDFIKGVEKLVDPIDVGTLHFMQSLNNFIPKKFKREWWLVQVKSHHIWDSL